MTSRTKKSAVAVSAVAALALIGGVAAQFSASSDSLPQTIGTGTVALSLDDVAPISWTQPISNLAAGDSVERFVDLRNAGTLDISGITVAQTNTLGALLSAPSDVSITIEDCTVAWNATTGACDGTQTMTLAQNSVRAWSATKDLVGYDEFNAGAIRHLKINTQLSADATNAVQNSSGTITYTFAGTQRSAQNWGETGNGSTGGDTTGDDAGDDDNTPVVVPVAAPSALTLTSTRSSIALSFTDTNSGAASYSLSYAAAGESPTVLTLPAGATTADLANLAPETEYSLVLTATKDGKSESVSTTKTTGALAGLNATTATWSTPSALSALTYYPMAQADRSGALYVMGGYGEDNSYNTTVSKYDPITGTRTTVAPMPVAVSKGNVEMARDGSFYVFGGLTHLNSSTGNAINSNLVQHYVPSTDTWTTLAPMPLTISGAPSATSKDGAIYSFGGMTSSYAISGITQKYEPGTNTWSQVAPIPAALWNATAVTGADGAIYVTGGLTASYAANTTVYKYTPSTNTWTTTGQTPVSLNGSSAVRGLDGTLLFVGGPDYPGDTIFIRQYNPATNTLTTVGQLPQSLTGAEVTQDDAGRAYFVGGMKGDDFTTEISRLG